MQTLGTGTKAPDFELADMDGRTVALKDVLANGPVVLAFFKISCPVCQFTFPYLQRIHQAAAGKNASVIAVSQNTRKDTQFFNRQYGITFPVLLDDPNGYKVSNAYGITNVPTIFYVAQDGTIEVSSVGWSKHDVLDIARRISGHLDSSPIPVFAADEAVPDFRAG